MRVSRWLIGLLLIQCAAALAMTDGRLLAASGAECWPPLLAAGAGVALWLALFALLPAPLRLYVLAHELTHALWGLLLGARVSGLRVSKSGGYARLSKTNVWITLAPYFFPLYAALVVLAYGLTSLAADTRAWAWAWQALIGISLSFHWSFTVLALRQPQSDVDEYGRLFSYALILALNLLVLGGVLVPVSPHTVGQATALAWADQQEVWLGCAHALKELGLRLAEFFA